MNHLVKQNQEYMQENKNMLEWIDKNNKQLAEANIKGKKKMGYKTIDNFNFIMLYFKDAPNFSFLSNAKEILTKNMMYGNLTI